MRAIKIAAFVLCVSLTFGMLGAVGWFGWVGVHPDPAIDNEDQVVGQADEIEASGEEGGDDGMLGLVSAALDTFSAFRMLTVQINSALINLGVPGAIAWPVQAIVTFTVMVGALQLIRGMRFR